MATGIVGPNEDRCMEGALFAREGSSRACRGTISGLALGIDMVEGHEAGAWCCRERREPCPAPGIGIQNESEIKSASVSRMLYHTCRVGVVTQVLGA